MPGICHTTCTVKPLIKELDKNQGGMGSHQCHMIRSKQSFLPSFQIPQDFSNIYMGDHTDRRNKLHGRRRTREVNLASLACCTSFKRWSPSPSPPGCSSPAPASPNQWISEPSMKGNGFNLGEVATALISDVLRGREMQLRELEVVADAEARPGSDLSEGLSRVEPRIYSRY